MIALPWLTEELLSETYEAFIAAHVAWETEMARMVAEKVGAPVVSAWPTMSRTVVGYHRTQDEHGDFARWKETGEGHFFRDAGLYLVLNRGVLRVTAIHNLYLQMKRVRRALLKEAP